MDTDFCSPQQKIWNHCKTAAANIVTDLFRKPTLICLHDISVPNVSAVIGLFLAILRTLHLGRRERWGVVIFLTISAVPVLAAILRLIIIVLALQQTIEDRDPKEVQHFKEILYLTSQVELTTAFIAACLPAMRVFITDRKEKQQYRAASLEYKGVLRSPQPAFVHAGMLSGTGTHDESCWEDDIELDVGSDTGLYPPEHEGHYQ